MWKVWNSIPGIVKSALCRRRLATAATFLCYPSAKRWAPVTFAGVGSQHSPSPWQLHKKWNLSFLKRTDFSSCGACRNCYHVFIPNNTIPPQNIFLQVQWSSLLTSASKVVPSPHKCFCNSSTDYDAMLQYRYPVVQLFSCVLLEVHFCHWCSCETIKK